MSPDRDIRIRAQIKVTVVIFLLGLMDWGLVSLQELYKRVTNTALLTHV